MQIGSKSILTQAIFFELPGILQVSDSLVQLQMKKVQLFAFGARYRNFNILFKFNSSELLLDIQYRRKIKKCTFLQNDSRLKLIFLQPEQFLLIHNKEVCDKFKIVNCYHGNRRWKVQLAGIPDLNLSSPDTNVIISELFHCSPVKNSRKKFPLKSYRSLSWMEFCGKRFQIP